MSETVSVKIKIDDAGSFKRVEVDAEDLRGVIRAVKEETDRLSSSVINWSQAAQAADMFQQTLVVLQSALSDLSSGYAEDQASLAKLGQAMRNTMDATQSQIDSVEALCEAQERSGVTSKGALFAARTQVDGLKDLFGGLVSKAMPEVCHQMVDEVLSGKTNEPLYKFNPFPGIGVAALVHHLEHDGECHPVVDDAAWRSGTGRCRRFYRSNGNWKRQSGSLGLPARGGVPDSECVEALMIGKRIPNRSFEPWIRECAGKCVLGHSGRCLKLSVPLRMGISPRKI